MDRRLGGLHLPAVQVPAALRSDTASTDVALTAGQCLRARYEAALARASRETGRHLEWTEGEALALEKAIESADRAEQVRALLDAELARPELRATKLSAEVRLLNKAQMDYAWRLNPGPGMAKSERHQRAGRARWEAQGLPSRGA
jgi:hypothetical protein